MTQHDTPEAVETMVNILTHHPGFRGQIDRKAAAMLDRLHTRAMNAERETARVAASAAVMMEASRSAGLSLVQQRDEAEAAGYARGVRDAAACYVRDGNPAVFHAAILALLPKEQST